MQTPGIRESVYIAGGVISAVAEDACREKPLYRMHVSGTVVYLSPDDFSDTRILPALTAGTSVIMGLYTLEDGTFWCRRLYAPGIGSLEPLPPSFWKQFCLAEARKLRWLPILAGVSGLLLYWFGADGFGGTLAKIGLGLSLSIPVLVAYIMSGPICMFFRSFFDGEKALTRVFASPPGSLPAQVRQIADLRLPPGEGIRRSDRRIARYLSFRASKRPSPLEEVQGQVESCVVEREPDGNLLYTWHCGDRTLSLALADDRAEVAPGLSFVNHPVLMAEGRHPFFLAEGDVIHAVAHRTGEVMALHNLDDGCAYLLWNNAERIDELPVGKCAAIFAVLALSIGVVSGEWLMVTVLAGGLTAILGPAFYLNRLWMRRFRKRRYRDIRHILRVLGWEEPGRYIQPLRPFREPPDGISI